MQNQQNGNVIGVITQMRVKPRRDRGGLEPKSKGGRRKRKRDPITQHRRSDYARPWVTQGHGPSTQRTRMDNDTGRNNSEYVLMITSKQINEQEVTARDGARIGYERTGRRTDADLCSLRRTE